MKLTVERIVVEAVGTIAKSLTKRIEKQVLLSYDVTSGYVCSSNWFLTITVVVVFRIGRVPAPVSSDVVRSIPQSLTNSVLCRKSNQQSFKSEERLFVVLNSATHMICIRYFYCLKY